MRSRLCTLCALMVLTGTAHAGTIWTGTNFQIDASAPAPVGIALEAVTLTVVGLNGTLPNSFDGISGGATGITTAGNSLHQVYEFMPVTGSPTPTLALLVPANVAFQPIDTHFLVDPPTILPVTAPSEDQNVGDATEAANAGYGSFLTGQFALSGAPPASWDFAYLVVPSGTTVSLDFRVADGSGTHPLEHVQTSFTIPEPTTACLLAIGALAVGLACFTRRRRKS